MRGEGGMKSLDSAEDEVAKVSKGSGVFHVGRAEEEVNADAFDEKVKRLAHVVHEWHGDAKVFGDGREVGDGVEV